MSEGEDLIQNGSSHVSSGLSGQSIGGGLWKALVIIPLGLGIAASFGALLPDSWKLGFSQGSAEGLLLVLFIAGMTNAIFLFLALERSIGPKLGSARDWAAGFSWCLAANLVLFLCFYVIVSYGADWSLGADELIYSVFVFLVVIQGLTTVFAWISKRRAGPSA